MEIAKSLGEINQGVLQGISDFYDFEMIGGSRFGSFLRSEELSDAFVSGLFTSQYLHRILSRVPDS